MSAPPTIELTAEERSLFELLMAAVSANQLQTTLRVAGGWVRDKIMGRTSHDIDVALDNMKGLDFAALVKTQMEGRGMETHEIGSIKANPEQSKHLDTATMKVMGGWIDFVNLRAEEYASDSRIPTSMDFGTPLQDALRRDLTINALFYNINKQEIEDFTGKGVDDLRAGIIRTPLPPLQTFLDDPLRVLRTIRFASRFGFRIEPEIEKAMEEFRVQAALNTKVSRERFGIEVGTMLGSPSAAAAMDLIEKNGLFNIVFNRPNQDIIPNAADAIRINNIPTTTYFLDRFRSVYDQFASLGWAPADNEVDLDGSDPDTRRQAHLAALLFPMAHIFYKSGKTLLPVPDHVIKNSLKLKNKDSEAVLKIQAAARALLPLIGRPSWSRAQIGTILRAAGKTWRFALVLAVIEAEMKGAAASVTEMARFIDTERLEGVWDLKPLLNGKELQTAGRPRLALEGKMLGAAVESLIHWQMEHPEGSKEDATAWVANTYDPAAPTPMEQ